MRFTTTPRGGGYQPSSSRVLRGSKVSMFATPTRNAICSIQLGQKHVFLRCFLIGLPPLPHETLTFRPQRDPKRPHFGPKPTQTAPRGLAAPCFTVISCSHLRHSAAKRSFLPQRPPESQHLRHETLVFAKSAAPLAQNANFGA